MPKTKSTTSAKRKSAKRPLKRQNAGYGTSLMCPPQNYSKPEKKDISSAGPIVSTVAVADQFITTAPLINGISQGVGSSQRIGRQILMKSLELTISCQFGPTPSNNITAPRLVVFYDRQAAVSSPAITSVFNTNHFQSYKNLSSKDRFIILIDAYIEPIGGVDNLRRSQTFYRKLNLPVMFNGTGSSASDITTGTIQYYYGSSDISSCFVTSRIMYTDA
ncbi:MAG: coat protein [Circoviridae sp.]|nr:MAG: coat protein [Circoviridae sp.]